MFTVDTNETRRYAGDLMQVAQSLVSVAQALNNTKIVGAIDGKYAYRIDGNIRKAQSMAITRQRQAANLSTALMQIVTKYEEAEEAAKEHLSSTVEASSLGQERKGNITESSKVFDDKGGYGGDQGDLNKNHRGVNIFGWVIGEDEAVYDLVRSQPGYENYTDGQIADLLKKMNSEGCGYIAIINSLFVQYESDPDLFERRFGFPMYDENGEFNFNRLFIDFYCATDDKYFLDDSKGMDALTKQILGQYSGKEKRFKKEYGVDLYDENGNYSVDAMQAIADRYQDQHEVTIKTSGTNAESFENRMTHYLHEKGADATFETHMNAMSASEIQKALDKGKCVNIRAEHFNLYDEHGNVYRRDVGGHRMTVTGVTPDGRYIVSSWGKKLYINPSELTGKTEPNVVIVDVTRR